MAVTGGRGPESGVGPRGRGTGVRRGGLGRRLVREVADVLRAEGAQRLVAVAAGHDGVWPALLEDAGFTSVYAAIGRGGRALVVS